MSFSASNVLVCIWVYWMLPHISPYWLQQQWNINKYHWLSDNQTYGNDNISTPMFGRCHALLLRHELFLPQPFGLNSRRANIFFMCTAGHWEVFLIYLFQFFSGLSLTSSVMVQCKIWMDSLFRKCVVLFLLIIFFMTFWKQLKTAVNLS